MRSIELFAGAGGLAMGVARAGFKHEAVLERDADTCVTLRENQRRGIRPVADWPLVQTDVRHFDYGSIRRPVNFVAGGPPCQPFSLGGKHRGHADRRDMFPEAVRAVRELRPVAFMFENVRGLVRDAFSSYFDYVVLQLRHPEVVRRAGEDWAAHLSRLEQHHTAGGTDGLWYNVVFRVLNAADYGVPQRRERVFIVGFRGDLGVDWSFPEPTHSADALLWDQWVTGDYWERHCMPRSERPEPSSAIIRRAQRLKEQPELPMAASWRTVRDAIADLPDPELSPTTAVLNHRANPGARAYPGHTGSPLDEPAKTLKAGDHGVPGGENMLVGPGGRLRYFTVRESARLQCFPDDYLFPVSWTESMRQLGNAVPVDLGYAVAKSIHGRVARFVAEEGIA